MHRRYYICIVLCTTIHALGSWVLCTLNFSAFIYSPLPPTYIIPTYIQNGWNVLHHTCASDEKSYDILHWLLEEFTHCDLLRTRDFLNQVEQVWLCPLPILSISLFLSKSKLHS